MGQKASMHTRRQSHAAHLYMVGEGGHRGTGGHVLQYVLLSDFIEKIGKIVYSLIRPARTKHCPLAVSILKLHIHEGKLGANGQESSSNTHRAAMLGASAAHGFNREKCCLRHGT